MMRNNWKIRVVNTKNLYTSTETDGGKGSETEDELIVKKTKYEEFSSSRQSSVTKPDRSRQKSARKEIIEIDTESEEEYSNESVDKLEETDNTFKYISTPAMLYTTRKLDKNIQTIPTDKLSTNTSKAGKLLGSSGSFKSAKVNYASKPLLARVLVNTKSTQTGRTFPYSGKVLYPSEDSPSKNSGDEPIYDCTFHKYCIVNKTKFFTKEELTKHIVTGFKNQPHVATERRPPLSYCQRKKDQDQTPNTNGEKIKTSTDSERQNIAKKHEQIKKSEATKLSISADRKAKVNTKRRYR